MSTEQNTQQQNQNNDLSKESQKIKDAHDAAMGKVVALFKGESNLNVSKKIPNETVATLMGEVLKEEVDAKKADFKHKAKALMKSKVAYDKFLKEKKQEFQKAIDAKTKEFTKEANDLIFIVDSIGELQKDYLESLGS